MQLHTECFIKGRTDELGLRSLITGICPADGIAPRKAIGDHASLEAVSHRFDEGVIPIQDRRAILRQCFDQLGLRLRDIFLTAQDPDMRCANIGHDTDGRACDRTKLCDLSEAAHPHFHDADFRLFRHREECHGKADLIIEIFLCRADMKTRRQERRRHVFRRCFSIRARDADHRYMETHTVKMGEIFQRLLRILHEKRRYIGRHLCGKRSIRKDDSRSPFFARLFQKGMPIKIFSFKSQKQIARLDGAGIGTDPVHGRLPASLEQLGAAGSFYFFYRK